MCYTFCAAKIQIFRKLRKLFCEVFCWWWLASVGVEEAFCFEEVGDGAAGYAEFFCDLCRGLACLVEFNETVSLTVEDSFGCCAFCTFRTAKGYAFFALCMDDIETTARFHAAFDFDDFAEVVHKERHRAVREEGAAFKGNEGAAVVEQVLHDLEEHREAAAEGGDVVGDDGVAGVDWFYEVLYAVSLDLACEVILNPGVVGYVVGFAPQRKRLTFHLERDGVALELNV